MSSSQPDDVRADQLFKKMYQESGPINPQPVAYGKRWTREEWEQTHKPTCNVYPCSQWMGVHWHFDTRKSAPTAAPQQDNDGQERGEDSNVLS